MENDIGYTIRHDETQEFIGKFAEIKDGMLYFNFTAERVAEELDNLIDLIDKPRLEI